MDIVEIIKNLFINVSTKGFLPFVVFLYTFAIVYTFGKLFVVRLFNVEERRIGILISPIALTITVAIYLIFIHVMNLSRTNYIFDFLPAVFAQGKRFFEFIGANSSNVLAVFSTRVYKYSLQLIIKPVAIVLYASLIKFKFIIEIGCRFDLTSSLTHFDDNITFEESIYKLNCSFSC